MDDLTAVFQIGVDSMQGEQKLVDVTNQSASRNSCRVCPPRCRTTCWPPLDDEHPLPVLSLVGRSLVCLGDRGFPFFSFGCMSIIFFLHFSLIFFTFHRIVCSSWKPQRFPHFGSFVFNKTEKEEDILIYSLSLLPSLGSVVIRSNTRSKLFQFY